jgi:gamma-glutamylcyclotransferase
MAIELGAQVSNLRGTSAEYFAYGSNMNPDRMQARGMTFFRAEPATLSDYKLVFNVLGDDGGPHGYANIVPRRHDFVEGILYEISQADLAKLDAIEDVPTTYQRGQVRVSVESRGLIEATTYIGMRTGSGLFPTKEYLHHLILGSTPLSAGYRNWLGTIKTAD